MTDDASHDRVLPPAVIEKQIDLASDRFEAAWKTGAEPQIEAFLEGWKKPERTTLLQELVVLDLEYRWRRAASRQDIEGKVSQHIVHGSNGKSAAPHDLPPLPLLEDYVRRYSELGPIDRLPDELFVLEYEIRCRWGQRPGHDEYLKRFGHRISKLIGRLNETNGQQHVHAASASTKDIKSTRTLPQWLPSIRTRCPYCHHLIDLPEDMAAETFNCAVCHHTIDLVGGTSTRPRDVNSRRLAHFELVEELGSGGFGVVWNARDVRLDRTVALKIPRPNRLGTEDTEKFLREARTAAQLKHPNIVGIHEVGREDDSFYIVSDYIEGLPLDRWLADQPMAPREAAELCGELVGALQYAHAEGIIHRDLKPSNVMIDPQGRPHIMDFGLAKREVGEITMTLDGAILGTPAYMSPEQARGKGHAADRRSDIYSLGVILFELLTGELPFRGERQMLMVQILNDEPPSLRHLNNHVPRDLETICLKCLEKDPDRRYQAARDLADDLERLLNGQAINARPAGRAEKLWRWCKRKPAVAGLSVAVVLSLLIGSALSSYFAVDAMRKAQEAAENATIADQKANEAHTNLYVARMNLAERSWKQGNIGRVRELLEAYRPQQDGGVDARGWEWFYQWRASHAAWRTLNHSARCVAVSHDGEQILSGGSDGSLKLWDTATGRELWHRDAHAGQVESVAFSPDGKLMASSSKDGMVKVWSASTRQEVYLIDRHAPKRAYDVVFSPDGQILASSGEDHIVRLTDVNSGEEIRILEHLRYVYCVAFSPDRRRLATGGGNYKHGTLRIWDVASGDDLRSMQAHEEGIRGIAYSPNGDRLVTVGVNGILKIWDTENFQVLHRLSAGQGDVTTLAISSDGTQVAVAGVESVVRCWDVAT